MTLGKEETMKEKARHDRPSGGSLLGKYREVGRGEFPVLMNPPDGSPPVLHWFETEAEACAHFREFVRTHFGQDPGPCSP
jgi:hypothetical protein